MSDEQVAMVTDLANTAEIDQAKIAQGKARDARVKKFAATMINHHRQAKQKQAKLIGKLNMKPADSPLASQLKVDSEATLASLKGVTGADFDRTYMASQVDAHQKVLDALERELIPSATNPELKSLLMSDFQPMIDSHLKEAQDIQAALATAPTGTESKK